MLTKNWYKKINHDIYFINEIRFEKLIWYDKQLYIVKDGSVDNGETHYVPIGICIGQPHSPCECDSTANLKLSE